MKVVRSKRARADLVAIWRYIAQHDPEAASNFVRKLDMRCEALVTLPKMGRLRGGKRKDVRQLIEGDYLIVYRIVGQQIIILRFLHGRRHLASW